MGITRRSTVRDVAALVSQTLSDAGITAVLTGGSAVSIYSRNRYRSYDIDFVTAASRRELAVVMSALGFSPGTGRHFEHPATRLVAAFYHWRDAQALDQALLVARAHRVSMAALKRWSSAEGHEEDFAEFRRRLLKMRGTPISTAARSTR